MRLKNRIPEIIKEIEKHPYWGACKYNRNQGSFLEKCFYELATECENAGMKTRTSEWGQHSAYMVLCLKRLGYRVSYFGSALSDIIKCIKRFLRISEEYTDDFWTKDQKCEIDNKHGFITALHELWDYAVVYLRYRWETT